jgi:hypothetical protein
MRERKKRQCGVEVALALLSAARDRPDFAWGVLGPGRGRRDAGRTSTGTAALGRVAHPRFA